MTEQELLKKIKESADTISVPETLSPETIQQKLKMEQRKSEKEQQRRKKYRTMMSSAAAVLLVCVSGFSIAYSHRDKETAVSADESSAENTMISTGQTSTEQDAIADTNIVAESTQNTGDLYVVAEPKQNAGELYVVAENYGEVYDVLNAYEDERKYSEMAIPELAEDTTFESATPVEGAVSSGKNSFSTSISQEMGSTDIRNDTITNGAADLSTKKEKYSATNLQTAGVDESDIVKTDGSYIYTVTDSKVIIVDVQKEKMKQIGTIELAMNSASDRILEMYVDGNILNLIVQKESSDLEKSTSAEETTYVENSAMLPVEDVYYFNSKVETEIQTYDITDRTNPVLTGNMSQDGYYKTSRKIGEMVYLFTEKNVTRPNLTRGQAILEDDIRGWIPLVNGNAVAADCIYIPERGNHGLIISSVNVKNPKETVDNTLILNNYVDIYVSNGALYLYGQDYSTPGGVTQIAKFTLNKGTINAVGAATVNGQVRDTFAIHEYNGKLRILTTDWSKAQTENGLYLFDEKLNLTGKLEGLAKGEEIYAARYFGNTAYFVTYRNTDPLFAVDLTDEKNPKILSELKITGFSEYLHFWGEDKLLGIGYETDPDSGQRKGIKLTMFDISNPAQLKTAGTCVLKGVDSSPALYNYKCVLADEAENIIGFVTETYGGKREQRHYLLFAWENGDFKNLMTENLTTDVFVDNYRGIYIGNTFYLAERNSIISYDRGNDYRMLEKLELK